MTDIAKIVNDETGPGLYVTRYRNPRDGHTYIGPEINATCRAEADRIVARLSYGGQPLTIDGLLVEDADVKAKIDDELRRELRGKK